MAESKRQNLMVAVEDFRRARLRAKLEQIMARLTGGSARLLEYDEVSKKLKATSKLPRGLKNSSFARTRQDVPAARFRILTMGVIPMVFCIPGNIFMTAS